MDRRQVAVEQRGPPGPPSRPFRTEMKCHFSDAAGDRFGRAARTHTGVSPGRGKEGPLRAGRAGRGLLVDRARDEKTAAGRGAAEVPGGGVPAPRPPPTEAVPVDETALPPDHELLGQGLELKPHEQRPTPIRPGKLNM